MTRLTQNTFTSSTYKYQHLQDPTSLTYLLLPKQALSMSLAYIRSLIPGMAKEPSLIPEPPQSDPENPDGPPPVVAHRLDFVKLGLPEYEHKCVQHSTSYLHLF